MSRPKNATSIRSARSSVPLMRGTGGAGPFRLKRTGPSPAPCNPLLAPDGCSSALTQLFGAADGDGDALGEQQRESDRNEGLDDVAVRDAAGIGRALVDDVGLLHVLDRQPDNDD